MSEAKKIDKLKAKDQVALDALYPALEAYMVGIGGVYRMAPPEVQAALRQHNPTLDRLLRLVEI